MLLYTKDDVERQFGMSARSRLTRREIHGVLRALRRLGRRNRSDEVVASTGEILAEDEDRDFRRDSATDDTRARTALAWLEESELLSREENRVQVFPSSLRVHSVEEAQKKLDSKPLADRYRGHLLAIVETLIDADPDEGISTDMLMAASGLSPQQVRGALHDLERFGIASNDTALTAFVHVGVRHPSRRRLAEAAAVEEELLDLMREMAPDIGVGDSAPLNLRVAAQRLKDAGHDHVRPEHVARTLRGIAGDGRDDGSAGGSLTVRKHDAESVRVTLKREWPSLVAIAPAAARRRGAAARSPVVAPATGQPRQRPTSRDDAGEAGAGGRGRPRPARAGQELPQARGPLPDVAARAGGHQAQQGTHSVPPGHDHPAEA